MLHRRFTLSSTACVGLVVVGFGVPAKADYGVTSKHPLSDPRQARIDESVAGTWRAVIKDKTYYLHVGAGNIVGKFNWTELVLINPGEKRPSFYMHHLIGFPSSIDGESYFNVTHMSKLIPQLRGSRIEQLVSSVDRYEILKYKLTGDHLDIWAADQAFIRESIKAGKLKGGEARVDDTQENLIQFIKSSAPKLFVNKFRYTRIKETDSPPLDKPATVQKPSRTPEASGRARESGEQAPVAVRPRRARPRRARNHSEST